MIKKSLYVAAVLLCQLLSLPLNAAEEMSQKDLIRLAAFKKRIEGLNKDTPTSIDNTSMLLKAAFEDGRVMYKYQVKPDYFYQFDTADAEKMHYLAFLLSTCVDGIQFGAFAPGIKTQEREYYSPTQDFLFKLTISKSDCDNIDPKDNTGLTQKMYRQLSEFFPAILMQDSEILVTKIDLQPKKLVYHLLHLTQEAESKKEKTALASRIAGVITQTACHYHRRFFMQHGYKVIYKIGDFQTAEYAEKEIPPIFCFQEQAEQQQALKPLKDAIYARLMTENR